jgi:hypothetical protein
VELTIADASDGRTVRLVDVLFATDDSSWLSPRSLPMTPLDSWSVDGVDAVLTSAALPVLYGRRLAGGSFLEVSENGIELGIDIFGSAFFMLTRYEELVKTERDRHERFPADAALAVREGFVDRPIVNEYAELLWWTLSRLWPGLERRPRSFRQVLSHDVDVPLCPTPGLRLLARRTGGDLLRRRDPVLAARRLRASLAAGRRSPERDVCNTFDFIMDRSERLGLRSAFFFIAGTSDPRFDGEYSLDHPWLRLLLRRIHARGHEIGLHPSYATYCDPERTASELERLRAICGHEGVRQEAWGSRQHYLRFEAPTTWRHLDAAGIAYDSTLTFPEQPGFRCGVCFEYPVFDVTQRRRLDVRERPLIVMEVSLLQYQLLVYEDALARIVELKRTCRRFGGDFTLLWHNDHLVSRAERRLYGEALEAE